MSRPSRRIKRERYLNGQGWQCDKSPTGAHYWQLDQLGLGMCCHCKTTRQFKVDNHMEQPFQDDDNSNRSFTLSESPHNGWQGHIRKRHTKLPERAPGIARQGA